MPAQFSAYRQMGARAVDRVMAQPIQIVPRHTLPKRPLAGDGSRPPVTLAARLTLKPSEIELEGKRRGTDLGGFASLQGFEALLTISEAEVPLLSYPLKQGDLVVLLEPEPGVWPRWSILVARPSASGRIVAPLTRDLT